MSRKLNLLVVFTGIAVIALLNSCSNEIIDEEKPTISINYSDGFPSACENLNRGQSYAIKAKVTDNLELASYSVEIHHNFDHHTHDDQLVDCTLDPVKSAVNPLVFSKSGVINGQLTEYEINQAITISETVDTGDYHLALSVTDITGWQARTSVDIKIVE